MLKLEGSLQSFAERMQDVSVRMSKAEGHIEALTRNAQKIASLGQGLAKLEPRVAHGESVMAQLAKLHVEKNHVNGGEKEKDSENFAMYENRLAGLEEQLLESVKHVAILTDRVSRENSRVSYDAAPAARENSRQGIMAAAEPRSMMPHTNMPRDPRDTNGDGIVNEDDGIDIDSMIQPKLIDSPRGERQDQGSPLYPQSNVVFNINSDLPDHAMQPLHPDDMYGVSDMYALPEDSPQKAGKDGEQAIDILVTVVSTKGLRKADTNSGSDPYAVFEVSGKSGMRCRTPTVKDTQDPVWNYQYVFKNYTSGDDFTISIWDDDVVKDDLLGQAVLRSSDFYPQGYSGTLLLTNTGMPNAATVTVRVQVRPSSPPQEAVTNGQNGESGQQQPSQPSSQPSKKGSFFWRILPKWHRHSPTNAADNEARTPMAG
jgi:hypothetical protein